MAEAGRLEVIFEAVDKGLSKALVATNVALGKAGDSATQFNKRLKLTQDQSVKVAKGVGIASAALGGLAVVVGTQAVKAFSDFEQRLSDISTLITGDSTEAINQFSDGIKNLLDTVPVDADALGASAYSIVSAGITDTAEALNVLEESARLGVAGLGSTESATDLLTSALNAFQIDAEDADDAANVLFETVQAGKTTIDELAQSFGQVAPIAASTNVTFEELQAATAALTTSGLQTSVAQTQLRALFTELTREGTKLDKAFESVGITQVDAAIASDGFVATLERLKEESGLTDTEFRNLFGSVEASGAAISLLDAQNEAFNDTLANLRDGVSSVDDAFAKQQETVKAQTQLFRNQLNKLLINLGEKILPIAIKGIELLNDALSNLSRVGQFFVDNSTLVISSLIGIATAITVALLPALGALVTSIGAAVVAAAPFIALGVAVAAAVGLIITVIKNWDTILQTISDKLIEFFAFVGSGFMAMGDVVADVIRFITDLIEAGADLITGFFTAMVDVVKAIFRGLLIFFQQQAEPYKLAFQLLGQVFTFFRDLVAGVVQTITGFFRGLIEFFVALPGEIAEAIAGVKDILIAPFQSALDVILGIVNSIKSALSSIKNATVSGARKAGDTVRNAIGRVRSAVGFAGGGYTGNGPINKIAGVVHAGEYVIPARIVKRQGQLISALENMRVKGYSEGGPVTNYNQPINVKVSARGQADYNSFARYLSWQLRNA